MKIILAPDSFKGNMRSPEVCKIMEKAILDIIPETKVISIPMADGGEGTVDAAVAATGGHLQTVMVHDPLGRRIEAQYGITGNGKTAVMEMAAASGLELLKGDELNPLKTTTYGTGEVIRHILESASMISLSDRRQCHYRRRRGHGPGSRLQIPGNPRRQSSLRLFRGRYGRNLRDR